MNLRNRTLVIAGCAASALFALAGTAQAQQASLRIGAGAGKGAAVEFATFKDSAHAGTLTIDGRVHRITTRKAIHAQIVEAFECAGYDAWCSGRSVRVRVKDGCENADICWRSGEYTLRTTQRGTVLTITPLHAPDRHDRGRHDNGGWRGRDRDDRDRADRSGGRGRNGREKGRFAIKIEI